MLVQHNERVVAVVDSGIWFRVKAAVVGGY